MEHHDSPPAVTARRPVAHAGPGAWAGVVGPTVFVAVFLVEGWLRPGYDPRTEYVSALALGGRGWIQVANFIVVGASLLLFASAAARAFPQGAASRAGPILLRVVGAGYLLSGPFVMDPPGTAAAATTWHGLVHGVLGAIVFVLMPVVCFVYLRRFRRDAHWRRLWWPTLLLGTTTALVDVAFSVLTKSPGLLAASAPWAGRLQRLVIIPFMAWVVVFAAAMVRAGRSPGPSRGRPRA